MGILMENREIVQLLRTSTKVPRVGLPRDIDFSIVNKVLKVFIKKPDQNMQTNGAAFESWIIALKSWLDAEIKFVELDFALPDTSVGRYGNSKACHYNRFLYRLNNLMRMYPDWCYLNESKKFIVSEFMDWLKLNTTLLNHS